MPKQARSAYKRLRINRLEIRAKTLFKADRHFLLLLFFYWFFRAIGIFFHYWLINSHQKLINIYEILFCFNLMLYY